MNKINWDAIDWYDVTARAEQRHANAVEAAHDPATEKQRQYIGHLIDELGWSSEDLARYADNKCVDLVDMSKVQASDIITELKAKLAR